MHRTPAGWLSAASPESLGEARQPCSKTGHDARLGARRNSTRKRPRVGGGTRPELPRLLDQLRPDLVMVWTLARLSRSLKDLLHRNRCATDR